MTAYIALTADTATTSTTFADVLSTTLTTAGGDLDVFFSASGISSVSNLQTHFRLMVDGVAAGAGCAWTTKDVSARGAATMTRRVTGLSAASHTIAIQWCLGSAGTSTIDAATHADLAHGSLLVREV